MSATQRDQIRDYMIDGAERTLQDIACHLDYPEASVSAQLRHLRKPAHGGYLVTKKHVGGGLYTYRLASPTP
jgi:hypothetical protein